MNDELKNFKNSELNFTPIVYFNRILNELDIDIYKNSELFTYNSVIGVLYNKEYIFDFKEMKIKPYNFYKFLGLRSHQTFFNFNHFLEHFSKTSLMDCKNYKEVLNLIKLMAKERPELII